MSSPLTVSQDTLRKVQTAASSHARVLNGLNGLGLSDQPLVDLIGDGDDGTDTELSPANSDAGSSCSSSTDETLQRYEQSATSFFVCDLSEVKIRAELWTKLLPRIEPWYAVKCLPSAEVVSLLSRMGTGADCASKQEIELALAAGIAADSIIFANPCKSVGHLAFARSKGVNLMTFDNSDELIKIQRVHPQADLLVRIQVDDSQSVCQFNAKFGAALDTVPDLLAQACALNLRVIGVSFHVGSGCRSVNAFSDAVARAAGVFATGLQCGYTFSMLDVGGGFPGSDNDTYSTICFGDIAATLSAAIEQHFPNSLELKVIAEPGRYFATKAMTLCTQVHSKRRVPRVSTPDNDTVVQTDCQMSPDSFMYYLHDGVYGSFNCTIFDHFDPPASVLIRKGALYTPEHDAVAPRAVSSLWGPTCDSMDCISKNTLLPELEIGDWLLFDGMGAYTSAAASNFNGLFSTEVFYIDSGAC